MIDAWPPGPGTDLERALSWFATGCAAATLFTLSWALRSPERLTKRQEAELRSLKMARVMVYWSVFVVQAALTASHTLLASKHQPLRALIQRCMLTTAWGSHAVSLSARFPDMGSARVLPSSLLSVMSVAATLAEDAMSVTVDTHTNGQGPLRLAEALHAVTPQPDQVWADQLDIASIVLHSAALVLLVTLVVVDMVVSGHVDAALAAAASPAGPLLHQADQEPEPDPKEAAEKEAKKAEKEKLKTPRPTRMEMARAAFRYMLPDTGRLKLRLTCCFLLVAGERAVNLAVPLLYKRLVDTLSLVSTSNDANSSPQPARLGVGAEGASDDARRDSVVLVQLAATGLSVMLPFWRAFLPWGAAYLGCWYLRGGSGMEGLLSSCRDILWTPITQEAYRTVSRDVFSHLLDLDHSFHVKRKTGQIMRILDRGTSAIQDTVFVVLFNVVPQMADIVVACTYLLATTQGWQAVIVAVTVFSYVPLTVWITERRGAVRKRMNALDNAREARATDMLLNYETVKLFSAEEVELAGFDMATRQYQAAEYWQLCFLSLLAIVQGTCVWAGLVAGCVVCVRGVVDGDLTVGDSVLFITLMNQLTGPLTYFGSYYRQVQKALIDVENMFDLLNTQPRVREAPGAQDLKVTEGSVAFQDVVFGYSPKPIASTAPPPVLDAWDEEFGLESVRQPLIVHARSWDVDPEAQLQEAVMQAAVLKGVSFSIPGGCTMAVVGSSGSGKSTLLKLLLRFYDPWSGAVLLDGQDISKATLASVRRAIAVVPQDAVLFNQSIAYNIRYGAPEATDEEVELAATVAAIHDTISGFRKGYKTRVGERGLRLSGGEKQRVAFARALVKNPAVLVLDEATSSLDTLTEATIQRSVAALRTSVTTVIVAHRLSTIRDADIILVMSGGQVAAFGPHTELLETCPLYAAMWNRQLAWLDEEEAMIDAAIDEEAAAVSGPDDHPGPGAGVAVPPVESTAALLDAAMAAAAAAAPEAPKAAEAAPESVEIPVADSPVKLAPPVPPPLLVPAMPSGEISNPAAARETTPRLTLSDSLHPIMWQMTPGGHPPPTPSALPPLPPPLPRLPPRPFATAVPVMTPRGQPRYNSVFAGAVAAAAAAGGAAPGTPTLANRPSRGLATRASLTSNTSLAPRASLAGTASIVLAEQRSLLGEQQSLQQAAGHMLMRSPRAMSQPGAAGAPPLTTRPSVSDVPRGRVQRNNTQPSLRLGGRLEDADLNATSRLRPWARRLREGAGGDFGASSPTDWPRNRGSLRVRSTRDRDDEEEEEEEEEEEGAQQGGGFTTPPREGQGPQQVPGPGTGSSADSNLVRSHSAQTPSASSGQTPFNPPEPLFASPQLMSRATSSASGAASSARRKSGDQGEEVSTTLASRALRRLNTTMM